MRFRPLCIDYHARAEEIIITERDYNSRQAAASLLSHRRLEESSPRHHDDDGDVDETFVWNDEDEENRKPSNSLNDNVDGTINDRKYHDAATSKSSNDRPASRRLSIANAPRSSTHGNRSISAVFGPTIPPSECILRSIPPVTKGPIRGRLLPVSEITSVMGSIIGLHAKIGEEQFQRDNNFSSFDRGGKSHQQQHSFLDDASMFLQSGFTVIDHPMQVVEETNSINLEAVDTIELTNNAPSSPPYYKLLRHEPEDLTKIQSLKSLQLLNVTNFASEVVKLMDPPRSSSLRSKTTECALQQVVKERPTLSAKPKLSFISCDMINFNDFVNKNNLSLTSFFEDCHGEMDDFGNCPILQSRKLKPYTEDHLFVIRLDPDFDPSTCQSTSSSEDMDSAGLSSSLGDICSAAFILQELDLPMRIEHNTDVQKAPTLQTSCSSKHKFDFVEKVLDRFKESQIGTFTFESPLVLSDSLFEDSMTFPKKITLESDLTLYDDDDEIKPASSSQSYTAMDLPSLVQSLPFSCSRKTTIRRSQPQKRFVDSSARVLRIDALSNICGPTNVACLYLPQIEVRGWKDNVSPNDLPSPEEQKRLALNDNLISFARECVPAFTIPASIDSLDGIDLWQGQTSSYPILPWFACDDDFDEDEITDHTYVDEESRDLKRRTFCTKSVRVGDKERSRCALFTGCSSHFKAGKKHSYRGFLTNQIINPQLFQQRYKSMIELNKIHQRESISAVSIGSDSAVSPRQRSSYFSRMVVCDYADKYAPQMKKLKKQKMKCASFAPSLATGRHDNIHLQPIKKKNIAVMSGKQSAVVLELEYLSSSFQREKESMCVNDVLGCLGKENLNVRGELLHLATKAHELKEEEDMYLAELAVINRGRQDTPTRASFEDEISDGGDIAVDSYACESRKREANDGVVIEEDDAKAKKKKRKKDKKKKDKKKLKKEKKSHKRKHRDAVSNTEVQAKSSSTKKLVGDGCDPSSKCEENKPQPKSVKKLRIDEAVPSTNRKPWKAVPSIALGITPIHRPKEKRQTQSTAHMFETPKVPDKRDNFNINPSSLEESSSSGKSPNSVTVTNLADGTLFTETSNPKELPMMQSKAPNANNSIGIQHEDDSFSSGVPETASDEIESTLTILSSESFLEQFGECIMELASGRWFNTLSAEEKVQIANVLNGNKESDGNGLDPGIPSRAKINVSDCPLLDIAGADIELADDKALVIQRISTLNQSSKEFMKRMVVMAASGRYRSFHVILCIDADMRPSEIVTMQNAFVGCPWSVTFEYTSPRTLSSSIAWQFCNSRDTAEMSSRISHFASDENIQERARFLICLVPTMTVFVSLRCLCSDSSSNDGGATALQTLLSLARETSRDLFPHKVASMIPEVCAQQLYRAVNTASSFATK